MPANKCDGKSLIVEDPQNPEPANVEFNFQTPRIQIIKTVISLLSDGITLFHKSANTVSQTAAASVIRELHVHRRNHGAIWV